MTSAYKPVLWLVYEGEEILACMLGTFVSDEMLKGLMRFVVFQGPLIHPDASKLSDALFNLLLYELKRLDDKGLVYVEIRNIDPEIRNKKLPGLKAFMVQKRFSIVMDIENKNKNDVWRMLGKDKQRQIESSLKKGLRIEDANTEEDVVLLYDLLRVLYKRKIHKPLPAIELFFNFNRLIAKYNSACIKVIRSDEGICGGVICPYLDGKMLHEWYICGGDNTQRGFYPGVLATWAAIETAVEKNIPLFDFMGAGKADRYYGVRDFKLRFGGELSEIYRYSYVRKKAFRLFARWYL
jgi:hypothetical protein